MLYCYLRYLRLAWYLPATCLEDGAVLSRPLAVSAWGISSHSVVVLMKVLASPRGGAWLSPLRDRDCSIHLPPCVELLACGHHGLCNCWSLSYALDRRRKLPNGNLTLQCPEKVQFSKELHKTVTDEQKDRERALNAQGQVQSYLCYPRGGIPGSFLWSRGNESCHLSITSILFLN